MPQELASKFVESTLDELLFEVTLSDDDNKLFENQIGRLRIDGSGSVVFSVLVKGLPIVNETFLGGKYSPHGQLSFKALTEDGVDLFGVVRSAQVRSFRSRSLLTEWQLQVPVIESSYPSEVLKRVTGCQIRALIDPVIEQIFTMSSETKSTGFDNLSGAAINWLEIHVSHGRILLLEADKSGVSVLKVETTLERDEALRLADAFLHALSLVLGRRVRILSLSAMSSGAQWGKIFCLNSKRRPKRAFPLMSFDSSMSSSTFLAQATEYFMENRESPIMQCVQSFWDGYLLSWSIGCLQLTTGVERIRDFILDSPTGISIQKVNEKVAKETKALAAFKEFRARMADKLTELAAPSEAELVDRLVSEVRQFRFLGPKPLLLLAAQIVNIKVLDEEAENWRLLRNHCAHGGEIDVEDGITWLRFFDTVDILYRFVCALIGWSGGISEYGVMFRSQVAGRTNLEESQ